MVTKPLAYIAGAMAGKQNFNHHAFEQAKKYVETLGFEVITPVELNEKMGWNTPSLAALPKPTYRTIRATLLVDDLLTLHRCSAIFVLPDSEDSEGTLLEITYGRRIGCDIWQLAGRAYQPDMCVAYDPVTGETFKVPNEYDEPTNKVSPRDAAGR